MKNTYNEMHVQTDHQLKGSFLNKYKQNSTTGHIQDIFVTTASRIKIITKIVVFIIVYYFRFRIVI